MEAQEPVVIYTVTDPTRAELIRNVLQEEGILCEIGGETQGSFAGVLSIDILTRAIDADRARHIIEEFEEENRRKHATEEEDEEE